MKLSVSGLMLAGAMALSVNAAQADPTPMTTPAMTGPLTANPNPTSFDAGFGAIYVTGAVTGLAQYQSNAEHAAPGDGSSTLDLSNAFVSIQKTDGLFQFYVQAGEYAFPTLGVPYEKSSDTTKDTFGVVPVAYGKLQLSDTFSIEAGKLPTLIGAEYSFSTENMNIERGLLWEQEPVFSRGVQANYASGPLSVSLSWNDGFYTNVWNTGSGLVSYAFDSSNTLAFAASATPGRHGNIFSGSYAPGNQIYNLIYTWTAAPWLVTPYVQYQHFGSEHVGEGEESFTYPGASDWGVGLLGSYVFNPTWSLTGRVEYEDSSGRGTALLYGPKSNAWSFTITPTYQFKLFFIRAEASYTTLSHYEKFVDAEAATVSPDAEFECFGGGAGFGKCGNKSGQARLMLETGIVF